MKKSIVKIALLSMVSFSALSLNSCRDAIEIVQDGEINEEVFFSSVSNLESYLKGDVYMNADIATSIYLTSVITDEVKEASAYSSNDSELRKHIILESNSVAASIWLSSNKLLNRTTRLIENAKKITPSSSEAAKYNDVIAQARALRAFAYLQLLTYFSEDMSNDNALGTIILNEVPTTATKLPRSTNKEVYAVMEEDLTFAENNLSNQSSRYYASKDLVNAIRARVNLYRGKYDEAKKYAQAVISDSGLTLTQANTLTGLGTKPVRSAYSTLTEFETAINTWNTLVYNKLSVDPYAQIWSDSNQGEVVFAFARPTSGGSYTNLGSYYNQNSTSFAGSPIWGLGRNLFNLLEDTSGDIRRFVYVDSTSLIDYNYTTAQIPSNTDQLILDKYPGKGTAPFRNDVKVFRISEMYLILAECAVAEGDLTTARNYVQQVREARNFLGAATTPTYSSTQEALADILKERRVELCFEGHRYIDLKRLAAKAGVSMDRNATDVKSIQDALTTLANGDYRYTLPIPLLERTGNPNIQQNSGY